MSYKLREYQQKAVDLVIDWIKKSTEPCLIEAATGAGKSLIISEIAKTINEISKGKKVLCLAPKSELVKQNREKYLLTGNPASIYSASAGGKCLKHPVVFATEGTFKSKAEQMGCNFAAVVLDESHRITPTIKTIIDDMRKGNPNLRVIGMTATPYRLGEGYIYRLDENNKPTSSSDPYFAKCVYKITAYELLSQGFLTPPVISERSAYKYDTLHFEINRMGKFNQAEIDRAFIGKGRKTASIVADVIERTKDRRGVMFFAATIQHADEVLCSLPSKLTGIITGGTPRKERERIINAYKNQTLKYIVNVDVLTTGFDAAHTDAIALLRATESVALLQQIIGRGLRIAPDKKNILILDYAENLDRHCPDGDIFSPRIKIKEKTSLKKSLEVECPICGCENNFAAREKNDLYEIDKHGYYTLEGERITRDGKEVPAHYGRVCAGLIVNLKGHYKPCGYRWEGKECPVCEFENDIAARYCKTCNAELVDPNDKLKIDFQAYKKDPHNIQTDEVLEMNAKEGLSQKGNKTVTVEFTTKHRIFKVYFLPEKIKRDYEMFCHYTNCGLENPKTITYRKKPDSKFYEILAYNNQTDEDRIK